MEIRTKYRLAWIHYPGDAKPTSGCTMPIYDSRVEADMAKVRIEKENGCNISRFRFYIEAIPTSVSSSKIQVHQIIMVILVIIMAILVMYLP